MDISNELKDIEEKQKELLRRRREVLDNLHKVEDTAARDGVRFQGQRRRNSRPPIDGSDPTHINEADYHQKKRRYDNNERRGDNQHNKKLHSAISVPEKQEQRKQEPEFKIEKPEIRTVTNDVRKRNSNLFKNMMGYLGKAKETLEKQKPLLEKQDHAVHEAENKNQEQSSKLKAEFVKTLEEKRKQLLEDKIILEKSILEKDNTRLMKKTELYFTEISNFILTKEQPPIFWKPAKTKEVVDKLLEDTKKIINEKREQAIKGVEEVIKIREEALNERLIKHNNGESENINEDEDDNENKNKKKDEERNEGDKDQGNLESDESDIEK